MWKASEAHCKPAVRLRSKSSEPLLTTYLLYKEREDCSFVMYLG